MITPEFLLDPASEVANKMPELPTKCQPGRFELLSVGLPAPAVLNITAIPSRRDAQNVSQFFG